MIRDFLNRKIAIRCHDIGEYNEFLAICEKEGLKWANGKDIQEDKPEEIDGSVPVLMSFDFGGLLYLLEKESALAPTTVITETHCCVKRNYDDIVEMKIISFKEFFRYYTIKKLPLSEKVSLYNSFIKAEEEKSTVRLKPILNRLDLNNLFTEQVDFYGGYDYPATAVFAILCMRFDGGNFTPDAKYFIIDKNSRLLAVTDENFWDILNVDIADVAKYFTTDFIRP